MARPPILLVLRHNGLGDLVTVQPALRGLRRRFPYHKLIVTCPSWLAQLARYYGSADDLVSERLDGAHSVDPSDHQAVDPAVIAAVMGQVTGADLLVSLRTPGPELVSIIETIHPARYLTYRYEPLADSHQFPHLDFTDHILTRWARLLSEIEVTVDLQDLYLDAASLSPPAGHTVVHVGAGSPARLWPPERWAAVARALEASGHRVILTGSRKEAERVASIHSAAGLKPQQNVSGQGDIMDLARWVAGARLVVCVDTGISHLATALRRPALTLFGPVPPAWWGPPAGDRHHRTLWAGSLGDNYAATTDAGLGAISVEYVLDTIGSMQV